MYIYPVKMLVEHTINNNFAIHRVPPCMDHYDGFTCR